MKKTFVVLLAVVLIVWGANSAFALPSLQLDITPGDHLYGDNETVYATAEQFTLHALLWGSVQDLTRSYYVSAALVVANTTDLTGTVTSSGIPENGIDMGSFQFGTDTISATDGMIYGTPPAEYETTANNDLPSHGIYPTYYWEYEFKFEPQNIVAGYNAQDTPDAFGEGTLTESLYYANFNVNISGLTLPGYALHFDLYDITSTVKKSNIVYAIGDKAPFSHDGQSSFTGSGSNNNTTPEPATMILLGSGLLGLAGLGRKKNFLKK
jgi:hypothetical protein